MFKTRYEIIVKEEHYKVAKALVEAQGLTVDYVKAGPKGFYIGFKAKKNQVDELIKRLYKYNIAKGVCVDA